MEISDVVAKQAEIVAAGRQITLCELVLFGLEKILDEDRWAKTRAERLFGAMDRLPGFSAGSRLNRDDANTR